MPESILSTARDWWALIVGFAGLVAWVVRLEARGARNSDDIKDFKRHVEKQRAEDITNRRRDWDAMNVRLNDIQSDIKLLLQRTAGR